MLKRYQYVPNRDNFCPEPTLILTSDIPPAILKCLDDPALSAELEAAVDRLLYPVQGDVSSDRFLVEEFTHHGPGGSNVIGWRVTAGPSSCITVYRDQVGGLPGIRCGSGFGPTEWIGCGGEKNTLTHKVVFERPFKNNP